MTIFIVEEGQHFLKLFSTLDCLAFVLFFSVDLVTDLNS
jgi:hypothetical protein